MARAHTPCRGRQQRRARRHRPDVLRGSVAHSPLQPAGTAAGPRHRRLLDDSVHDGKHHEFNHDEFVDHAASAGDDGPASVRAKLSGLWTALPTGYYEVLDVVSGALKTLAREGSDQVHAVAYEEFPGQSGLAVGALEAAAQFRIVRCASRRRMKLSSRLMGSPSSNGLLRRMAPPLPPTGTVPCRSARSRTEAATALLAGIAGRINAAWRARAWNNATTASAPLRTC